MIRCLALLCAVAASPALAGVTSFDTPGPAPGLSGGDGFDVNTGVIGCGVGSGPMLPEYKVSPT